MEILKNVKNKVADVFQLIGPSIMPVIALLPIAALLMGIGSAMTQDAMIEIMPFLATSGVQKASVILNAMGSLIIGNLGLFFAVGIAMNLSGKSGMAALSGLVCFLAMHKTIEMVAGLGVESLEVSGYANVLGIYTFQCGVFGGLLVGLVVAALYNKFHEIQLPQSLGFFQGERFVPIVSVLAGMACGLVMLIIWPPIQGVFNAFTNWLTVTPYRFLCVFLYGFVMRLVQAFGMQHLIYPFFYFQMGEYTNKAGQTITGDSSIFFAQMADKTEITVGGFMTGSYIATVCCIAIAFAMYRTAKPERKQKVKGVLLGAALTAALTGVTEPIEFSFLLISPMLWFIYCVFVGFGYAVTDFLQIRLGTALAGNGLDYILYGIIPKAHNYLLFVPVAAVFFVCIYFIFKTYILKRNIKTIGREDESDIALEAELENNAEELPGRVLAYLGGAANIKSITNCITRVRAKVYDRSVVDLDSYKEIGAKAVVTPGSDNVQLVYGSASEKIANTIKHMIAGGMGTAASVKPAGYQAFAEGRLIAINEVTDEVFSQKTMGDGYAIIPKNGRVVSPVDGKIDSIFPTKHAFGIVASDGKEIILHMGLDTVELDGDGFEIKVSAGDTVSAGQEIAVMDLERIQELGKDTVIIQVFTNIDDRIVKAETGQMVKAGEKIAVTIE